MYGPPLRKSPTGRRGWGMTNKDPLPCFFAIRPCRRDLPSLEATLFLVDPLPLKSRTFRRPRVSFVVSLRRNLARLFGFLVAHRLHSPPGPFLSGALLVRFLFICVTHPLSSACGKCLVELSRALPDTTAGSSKSSKTPSVVLPRVPGGLYYLLTSFPPFMTHFS